MHSTIVCCGTGPSITSQQIEIARGKGFRLFACNNAYSLVPDCELLYSVNVGWWRHYWPRVCDLPCEKWTTNAEAADEFGLNWIAERSGEGLCEQAGVIHHGHGSGYSLVSMAHKKGAKRVALLGYDLKYSPDYDGRAKRVGSSPRHFFGEYPTHLQHWPSVQVQDGEHVELKSLYKSVRDQGLIELVNCTPGSALESILGYTPIDEL